jgi:hypothetical protein
VYPLYEERFPIEMLNYLRMARIQDVAQLAKLSFDKDVIISPENEYEVLQLVMADLRERLQGYLNNAVRVLLLPPPLSMPCGVPAFAVALTGAVKMLMAPAMESCLIRAPLCLLCCTLRHLQHA